MKNNSLNNLTKSEQKTLLNDYSYIMLFNFDYPKEKKKVENFLDIMPTAKSLNYGITRPGGKDSGLEPEINHKQISIWTKEEDFLLAWAYFNHRDLKYGAITYQDGKDYLKLQKSDSTFIKEFK